MALRTVRTSFTSVSWIPSDHMSGVMRLPMDVGLGRYDEPPPDQIDDLERFVADGRCRFANRIEAWAEIEDGTIVRSGSTGSGLIASTEVNLRARTLQLPAIPMPEIRTGEEAGDGSRVTFVQTAGGRTGAPFPRRAGKKKRLRLASPTAWTTVAVTIDADGTTSHEARGASAFPRHFFYDHDNRLVAKSATIDFADWTAGLHDEDTPWGEADRTIMTAEAESAVERMLSGAVMAGGQTPIREVEAGEVIMSQGELATSMDLILDGLVEITVDGEVVAECGPGALLGERSFLEEGKRTATVRALTKLKLAEASPASFTMKDLDELRATHRREHASPED